MGPNCIQLFKFVREIIRLVEPHCTKLFKFVREIIRLVDHIRAVGITLNTTFLKFLEYSMGGGTKFLRKIHLDEMRH